MSRDWYLRMIKIVGTSTHDKFAWQRTFEYNNKVNMLISLKA